MTESFALVGIFFAGLALNLTPCVYPMLTVTASIFSRGEKTSFLLSFAKALTYVLGIAVMYSTLGTAAALTGGFFGAILQSAWVRLLIALQMLVLALAMFGVYRLEVPAWLLTRLGARRVAGFMGLFVSGLMVGVFAAPCIGPPVIALLAHVAERQDPVYGFWLFFVLAAGLGFPYLVLGTFSHLLKALPKSGEWLVWVGRLFGVILLGFAAFYLMLAIGPLTSPKEILPSRTVGVEVPGKGHTVVWQKFTPALFDQAIKSGKPLVVDFFAEWCLPCQEMEATTYRNADVIKEMDRFERIKVDLTDSENETGLALAQTYEIYGIPTLLFFDAQGKELKESRVAGYVSAVEFIQVLSRIPSDSFGFPSLAPTRTSS